MLQKTAITLFAALAATAGAASLPIIEKQVQSSGLAKVEFKSDAIRLRFDNPEYDSGLILLPPSGKNFWDLSGGRLLVADVENLSPDKQVRLTMHINSGKREDKTFHTAFSGLALNPGEKRSVTMLLPHDFIYKAPEGTPGVKTVNTKQINSIEFFMRQPTEGTIPNLVDCRVTNVRLEGEPDIAAHRDEEKYFPFIDGYGQNALFEWPEKIHSDEDLKKAYLTEQKELASSTRPSEWNRFGGWQNGPQLEATGYFRTEKYKGKWYLVDPEGRLFFSQGVCVLVADPEPTNTKNRDKWFTFPVKQENISFHSWNLEKKYGTNYNTTFFDTLEKRLDHWGINTIGDWGNWGIMGRGRTPYTLQLSNRIYRMPGNVGRFANSTVKYFDVFDPEYIEAMKNIIPDDLPPDNKVYQSLTDPMCIGYFIDNEVDYGNRVWGADAVGQTYGDETLKSPAKQPAKQEFISDLKLKYVTIEKLNKAWETDYASWDAMMECTELPKTKKYMPDSDVFFEKATDQYFRLCREGIKSKAPHRLYFGSRLIMFDAVRKALFDVSKKYCDVMTVNIYNHSPANFAIGKEGFPDMPVLIGETHFGILDRGMFSPGLTPVGHTQEERALAYTRFIQGALVHPNIVGAHWFQFRDQPLTGRGDGENYEIGLVDVADTPYSEMTRAFREIGENMYQYRERGKLQNSMK